MYLNSLALSVKALTMGVDIDNYNVSLLLYADDIVLIAPNANNLQIMLNNVFQWCSKWRMTVNTEKTQIVHFRPVNTRLTSSSFIFNNVVLQVVSEYKYLGVYFDEFLTFKKTATVLSESASRALGAIRYRLKYLKECRYSSFTKLFTSCVIPIMEYGASVWGTKLFENIERVQHKAIRYFLGVPRFALIHMLLGDMGWVSCFTRHKLCIIRLWNRLTSLLPYRLTSKVFLWDLGYSANSGSWSYCAKTVLDELNMLECFNNIEPCDLVCSFNKLKQIYETNWNQERYNKPKLRYYNMFKTCFDQENYLSMNISKYYRSLFAQFRAGILPLQVEVGRFRGLPLEERLCVLCPLGLVEDEYHFLCVCYKYHDLRNILYNKVKEVCPGFELLDDMDKFVYLVTNQQFYVIKFLVDALRRRNATIYV
jgi:hypothetical protein